MRDGLPSAPRSPRRAHTAAASGVAHPVQLARRRGDPRRERDAPGRRRRPATSRSRTPVTLPAPSSSRRRSITRAAGAGGGRLSDRLLLQVLDITDPGAPATPFWRAASARSPAATSGPSPPTRRAPTASPRRSPTAAPAPTTRSPAPRRRSRFAWTATADERRSPVTPPDPAGTPARGTREPKPRTTSACGPRRDGHPRPARRLRAARRRVQRASSAGRSRSARATSS